MLDIKECCRLCLNQKQPSMKDCADDPLSNILRDIFGIVLTAQGTYSTKVCRECIFKVWDFNLYRTSVLNNQKSLEQYKGLQESLMLSPSQVKMEDEDDVILVNYEGPSEHNTTHNTRASNSEHNKINKSTPAKSELTKAHNTRPTNSEHNKINKSTPAKSDLNKTHNIRSANNEHNKTNKSTPNTTVEQSKSKQLPKTPEKIIAEKRPLNLPPDENPTPKKIKLKKLKIVCQPINVQDISHFKLKEADKKILKLAEKQQSQLQQNKGVPKLSKPTAAPQLGNNLSEASQLTKNLNVGTMDSDEEDRDDGTIMTLKDYLDKYNKNTVKTPEKAVGSKVTNDVPTITKVNPTGKVTIPTPIRVTRVNDSTRINESKLPNQYTPKQSISKQHTMRNGPNKKLATTPALKTNPTPVLDFIPITPKTSNLNSNDKVSPKTAQSGVFYTNITVSPKTLHPRVMEKLDVNPVTRPSSIQSTPGGSAEVPKATTAPAAATSTPTSSTIQSRSAGTPQQLTPQPKTVVKSAEKGKISKLIIYGGKIFNEQGNCLGSVGNNLKSIQSVAGASNTISFKVTPTEAQKLQAAITEKHITPTPGSTASVPAKGPFPVQLISVQQPGKIAVNQQQKVSDNTSATTLDPGLLDSIIDHRVKVLSVNELNMRAHDGSNADIRKLPIRITLVKIKNEVQIKLTDSKNNEIHYSELTAQEQVAVKTSLLQPSSRAQIIAAIKSCKPDQYSQKMLETFGISATDLA